MSQFEKLWNSFPKKEIIKSECTNKQRASNKPFSDYCAIMLSDCLIKSGVDISLLGGNRCWSHEGKKHILLAEQMANGLVKHTPTILSKVQKVNPINFQETLKNKTGVIFFKDYWQRGKEKFENRSGDHIDLWNKNEITGSGMFMRSIYEFFNAVSDLNKSKEIWFWEVK